MEYYEIEMRGKLWLENLVSTPAYVAGDEGRVIYQSTDKALYFADDTSWRTVGIPSGTRMLFYQNTAPTGWTIFTSVDDTLVYFTKGSAVGGNAGGAVKSASTWNQPTHAHSVTPSGHTHTVPPLAYSGLSHTHTVATHAHTGPSHTHTGPSHTHTGPSHTHTGPSHTHSMANHAHTTGSLALSFSEMVPHSHYLTTLSGRWDANSDGDRQLATEMRYNTGAMCLPGTASAHNHGNTGNAGAGSTEASGTAATGASGTAATGASGTDLTGASGTGLTAGSGTLTTSDAAAGESGTTGGGSTGSTSSGTVTSADSATENSWRPSGHCVIICTKN